MGEAEVPQPLDILFRNVRYLMFVTFYCTEILVAKHLVKACGDYTVPARKLKEREVARFEGEKKDGRIEISGTFEITTFQKWCRIGLIFRFSETIKWCTNMSPLLDFNSTITGYQSPIAREIACSSRIDHLWILFHFSRRLVLVGYGWEDTLQPTRATWQY